MAQLEDKFQAHAENEFGKFLGDKTQSLGI
jgi:hypothetical protein